MPTYQAHTICPACGRPDVDAVSDSGKKWWFTTHYPVDRRTGRVKIHGRWCMRSMTRVNPDAEFTLQSQFRLKINEDDLPELPAVPLQTAQLEGPPSGLGGQNP